MRLSQLIKELQTVREHLENNGLYGDDPEVYGSDPGNHRGTNIEQAKYFIQDNKLMLGDWAYMDLNGDFLLILNRSLS